MEGAHQAGGGGGPRSESRRPSVRQAGKQASRQPDSGPGQRNRDAREVLVLHLRARHTQLFLWGCLLFSGTKDFMLFTSQPWLSAGSKSHHLLVFLPLL